MRPAANGRPACALRAVCLALLLPAALHSAEENPSKEARDVFDRYQKAARAKDWAQVLANVSPEARETLILNQYLQAVSLMSVQEPDALKGLMDLSGKEGVAFEAKGEDWPQALRAQIAKHPHKEKLLGAVSGWLQAWLRNAFERQGLPSPTPEWHVLPFTGTALTVLQARGDLLPADLKLVQDLDEEPTRIYFKRHDGHWLLYLDTSRKAGFAGIVSDVEARTSADPAALERKAQAEDWPRFAGRWRISEARGRGVPREGLAGITVVIADKTWTTVEKNGNRLPARALSLHASGAPKQLTVGETEEEPATLHWAYKFENDTLTLSALIDVFGSEPDGSFGATNDPQATLFVLTRIEPESKPRQDRDPKQPAAAK